MTNNSINDLSGSSVLADVLTTESSDSRPNAKASANTFVEQYTETLRRKGRDVECKLLPAGARVIRHPDAPDEFMADTPGNRRLFEERDFAWTDRPRRNYSAF